MCIALGKSQITASIAGTVTAGGHWPVDRQLCELGEVIFLSAEDDPADTIRPRLEAAGADLRRVHFIDGVIRGYTGSGGRADRAFSLQNDVEALGKGLAELGDVTVVAIDPVSAYLGNTDSHKNADVRHLLAPLSDLAARSRQSRHVGHKRQSGQHCTWIKESMTKPKNYLRRGLESYRKVPGPEHPYTQREMFGLSRCFFAKGNYAEAEQLASAVLESNLRLLGPVVCQPQR